MNDILGAVLAGGLSSRFGSDKAMAELDGATLLEHAVAGLAHFAGKIVVCGRDAPGHLSLPDRPAPGIGPLGGLNAALWWAQEHGYRGVLTSGCDTPHFPDDLGERLIGEDPAFVEGHHLIGFWPASLAERLDAHLRGDTNRAVRRWIELAGARPVTVTGDLPNINTAAELEALRRGVRLTR